MSKVSQLTPISAPDANDLLYVVDTDNGTDHQLTFGNFALASIALGYLVSATTPIGVTATPTPVTFASGGSANMGGTDPLTGTITTPVTGLPGGGLYQVTAQVLTDYAQGSNNADENLILTLQGSTLGDITLSVNISTGNAAGVTVGYSGIVQLPDNEVLNIALSATADQATVNLSGTYSIERKV